MADDEKKILPIDYTHREFSGIRNDLLEMAERFYPDTFQDFSEASFGAMMIDAVAYVGDQLSLYLDYNVNESFLDTSYQLNNIVRHGRVLGYKNPGRPSTYGTPALYVQVPASTTGMGPDTAYLPMLKRGTTFTSANGLAFVLLENVSFSDPANQVIVSQQDNTTGAPTYYAVKAYGNVVSGRFGQEEVTVGSFERFKSVKLSDPNISEIISVFDSEGHQYFEVDYLAQDMIFKEITNNNFKDDNVPSVIKPILVSRKFVVERARYNTFLQFGSGRASESNVVARPGAVAMDLYGKSYVTDTTFDPTRLSKNKNFGICPANTVLTITYRSTNPMNSNVAVGGLNSAKTSLMDFVERTKLSTSKVQAVIDSLEVSNETPIVGDVSNPSGEEIKRRIFDTFPTQNRAVTQADYENIAYRMPAKFGSVKRCTVFKDQNSLKRNLNMYVISEDSFGKLTKTNTTIKNNLKSWIEQYRMINDTVDILDPYIINLGIDFVIKPVPGAHHNDVLHAAITALTEAYKDGMFIGEAISISQAYSTLNKVEGILDVVKIKFNNKIGGAYAPISFNVNKNLSPEGDLLMAPQNAIFEIKYPSVDIKGKVR
jgi:hypothetical protein